MGVWFTGWLQSLLREEAILSCAASDAGTPTNDRRDNMLLTRERAHALSHGGAID